MVTQPPPPQPTALQNQRNPGRTNGATKSKDPPSPRRAAAATWRELPNAHTHTTLSGNAL
eukprot:437907-Lingulodinium_polyedra.AAC.1